MRRVFLSVFLFDYLVSVCFASIEVMPYYINSIKKTGIGLTSISSPLVMKQEPKNEAKTLEILTFDYKNPPMCAINEQKCNMDDIFIVYKEDEKLAFLSTLDETNSWALVCFNQVENPVCGWVKEEKNRYYTWSEFYNYFGKKYGLYFLKDVQKSDKVLYSAPAKQTNSTGFVEMAKNIAPWLVQGNWVLVKIIDFGNTSKTGWLNYRDDRGRLKLFVKF